MGNDSIKSQLSSAQKVHAYAKSRVGQQVGRGEYYDLADSALKYAGAKSAPHFGKITDTADYVWGKEIKLRDAQSGDILQFRNHKIKIKTRKTTRKTFPNGGWDEKEETREKEYNRGHHTAVVASNTGKGAFIIFEQHVRPPGQKRVSKKVQRNTIYIADSKSLPKKTIRMQGGVKVEVTTTTTIEVAGKIWAYRAVPE